MCLCMMHTYVLQALLGSRHLSTLSPEILVLCAPPFLHAGAHWIALWKRCWERTPTSEVSHESGDLGTGTATGQDESADAPSFYLPQ